MRLRVSEHECMSVSVTNECGCKMSTRPCVNMSTHECACECEYVRVCGCV